MVVLLAIASFVGRFMLMRTILLVMQAGPMALLCYFASYYTLRGGSSSTGAPCGAFAVYSSSGFSSTVWLYGAALSFKLDRLNLFSYI